MEYIGLILSVALIHFLAVASPGPDFIMVVRNSLVYSKRSGVYTAVGISLGILLHVVLALIGVSFIISQSVVIFTVIKFLGAAYLIYIGIRSLGAKAPDINSKETVSKKSDLSRAKAIRIGFVTNATNPKAVLFFLSLFTLVIQTSTPLYIKSIMGLEMAVITFAWFALVAVAVSHPAIKRRLVKFQHYIERVMGVILIVFGIVLATAHLK